MRSTGASGTAFNRLMRLLEVEARAAFKAVLSRDVRAPALGVERIRVTVHTPRGARSIIVVRGAFRRSLTKKDRRRGVHRHGRPGHACAATD